MAKERRRRIVLAGEEAAGARAFAACRALGHEVVLVLTSPPQRGDRSTPLARAAAAAGVPRAAPELVRDPGFAEGLAALSPDVLLNVHSLHPIAPAILAVPRLGAFNLHPGPLPAYAGLDAPLWAVYHRETKHGVTLHRMTAEIDGGPILWRRDFALTPRETGLSLFLRCIEEGLALVRRFLEAIRSPVPRLIERPQDPAARSYFRRGPPNGGRLDLSRSAVEIDAFVRAADFHPFPSPWGAPFVETPAGRIGFCRTQLLDLPCTAAPGTLAPAAGGALRVATGDGWLLLERVLAEGRRRPAAEALHGLDRLPPGGPVP